MSKTLRAVAAMPQKRRRSSSNILIVANSPGSRRYSYEQLRAHVLKVGYKVDKAVGSETLWNVEARKPLSEIPMRGRFTVEEIVRAIDKAKQ
jgi:hypothetical protein